MRSIYSEAAIMSFSIEQIRLTADRVAASHGLDVVEIEYLGGSKHRVLRVFIEQNPEQRTRRAEEANANVAGSPRMRSKACWSIWEVKV